MIINEAQQYPDLFKVLRGVIDSDRSAKGRFLLTGSNSPDIVKGITESLAGRIATIEMAPFKQGEYHDQPLSAMYEMLLDTSTNPKDFLQLNAPLHLQQSMNVWFKGGFPEPLLESEKIEDFHKHWMENYIVDYEFHGKGAGGQCANGKRLPGYNSPDLCVEKPGTLYKKLLKKSTKGQ